MPTDRRRRPGVALTASVAAAALALVGWATPALAGRQPDPDRVPAKPLTIDDGAATRAEVNGEYGPLVISNDQIVRRITFPVADKVTWTDTFGACRDGCARRHEGQDLMGRKLDRLVSTVDGTVTTLRDTSSGTAGNWLTVTDADGWSYNYMHVNNDSPGTDDGANPAQWRFGPGITLGAKVTRGQLVGYMGDSGNAEGTAPHLHFEIRKPDDSAINPKWSLEAAQNADLTDAVCRTPTNPEGTPDPASGAGYWATGNRGELFAFGDARDYGSIEDLKIGGTIVGLVPSKSGEGYYQLGADGGVFTFGDARFVGSAGDRTLSAPAVGMATTPSGRGYWVATADGRLFNFGDARSYGSLENRPPSAPIVELLASPSGRGYRMVGADGAVYDFGDAEVVGSLAGTAMFHPIVAAAATPTGKGYWLVNRRGRVFAFGDAVFQGGLRGLGLCRTTFARSVNASRTGNGYWILERNGRIHAFGDARDLGDPALDDLAAVHLTVSPQAAAPSGPVRRRATAPGAPFLRPARPFVPRIDL